jgi:hypothetical protein
VPWSFIIGMIACMFFVWCSSQIEYNERTPEILVFFWKLILVLAGAICFCCGFLQVRRYIGDDDSRPDQS